MSSNPADTTDEFMDVVDAYREKGYDFIFMTNHNYISSDLQGDCDKNNDCIIMARGAESGWACPKHIIVLGNTDPSLVLWEDDNLFNYGACQIDALGCAKEWEHKCYQNIQARINTLKSDGALLVMAHPQGSVKLADPAYEFYELTRTHGYTGIEIWSNGADSTQYWDRMLQCKYPDAEPVWGFAADDCENINGRDVNIGWIEVNSNKGPVSEFISQHKIGELNQDLLDNIEKGNFFAVHLKRPSDVSGPNTDTYPGPKVIIGVNGSTINVLTDKLDTRIRFIIYGLGKTNITTSNGPLASYTASGTEDYIRAEVEQEKTVSTSVYTYTVFSQPIYIRRDLDPADQGVNVKIRPVKQAPILVSFSSIENCMQYGVEVRSLQNAQGIFPADTYKIEVEDNQNYYFNHPATVTVPTSGFVQVDIEMVERPNIPEP